MQQKNFLRSQEIYEKWLGNAGFRRKNAGKCPVVGDVAWPCSRIFFAEPAVVGTEFALEKASNRNEPESSMVPNQKKQARS